MGILPIKYLSPKLSNFPPLTAKIRWSEGLYALHPPRSSVRDETADKVKQRLRRSPSKQKAKALFVSNQKLRRSSKVASTIRSLYLIPAQTFSEVRKLQRAAKEIWRPLRTFCTAFLLLRRHPPPISTLQSFISFPKGFCHFDFPIFAFSIHTWEKQRRLPIRDGADKGLGRNRISNYMKRPVLNRFFVFKAIKIQTFKNRGFFIKPGLLTI